MPALTTSALALVYPALYYASPVWINSSHCFKIYIQLHHSMHVISGIVKSMPVEWLAVLYKILRPDIWRKKAACEKWSKYLSNTSLLLHQDTTNLNLKLKYREPTFVTIFKLFTHWKPVWRQGWMGNWLAEL